MCNMFVLSENVCVDAPCRSVATIASSASWSISRFGRLNSVTFPPSVFQPSKSGAARRLGESGRDLYVWIRVMSWINSQRYSSGRPAGPSGSAPIVRMRTPGTTNDMNSGDGDGETIFTTGARLDATSRALAGSVGEASPARGWTVTANPTLAAVVLETPAGPFTAVI